MDLIAQNDLDRKGDLNSLLVSSTPHKTSEGEPHDSNENAAARKIVLTFQRQGDTVSLLVNGKEAHHEVYLMPLIGEHDHMLIAMQTMRASGFVHGAGTWRCFGFAPIDLNYRRKQVRLWRAMPWWNPVIWMTL